MHIFRQTILLTLAVMVTLPLFSQVPTLPPTQLVNSNASERRLEDISQAIIAIQTNLTQISTNLAEFRTESKPSFWKDLGKSLLSSFVYDLLTKRESTPSKIAKWASVLSLFAAIGRLAVLYFDWTRPKSKTRQGIRITLNISLGIYFVFLMLLAFKLFWTTGPTGAEVHRVDTTMLEQKFDALSGTLIKAQAIFEDGMQRGPARVLQTNVVSSEMVQEMAQISQRLASLTQQVSQTKDDIKAVDLQTKTVVKGVKSDLATDGWQDIQTTLLFIIVIGLVMLWKKIHN